MIEDAEARRKYFLWYEAQHFTRPQTLQVLPQVTPASFLLWWPPLTVSLVTQAESMGLVALALANPTCPHDVLREWFAKYPHLVASNPGLAGVDTEWFDKAPTVTARLLRNPAVGQEFPERLDSLDERFREAWLSNPNNDKLESELGSFPQAVAANPNAGDLLQGLDRSAPEVRVLLSRNPSTPQPLLEELSRDADPRVRCGVAFTTQDKDALELLKSDPDRMVSDAACLNRKNPNRQALVPNKNYRLVLQGVLAAQTASTRLALQKAARDLGSENLNQLVNASLVKDSSSSGKASITKVQTRIKIIP